MPLLMNTHLLRQFRNSSKMIELQSYFHTAISQIPTIVYWLLLVVFGVGLITMVWSRGVREGLRSGAVLLLVEWVFVLLGIAVIFREPGAERAFNLIPLSSYFQISENSDLMEKAAINILNVVMFFPVGLLLGLGFKNMTWKSALAIIFGLSVMIELLQLFFKCGLCEVDDVIHNVVGGAIGYLTITITLTLTLTKTT